jgi:hypothetical protein
MKRLTPQAINVINNNGALFGKICDELGFAPAYLTRKLVANDDERLAGSGVIELIKNHLADMQDMKIVEESNNKAAA